MSNFEPPDSEQRRQAADLAKLRGEAYQRGQNIMRALLASILLYRDKAPSGAGRIDAGIEVANGFTSALMNVADDMLSLLPPHKQKWLPEYIADDLVEHAEAALSKLGDGWVSPWLVHADKLRAEGANGLKLQFLTIGLYQEYETFDCGRCLTGLDEDFRTAAIAMLDSFSRHGRDDPHFARAAEALLGHRAP
ncbi:MAG: hypothetical protein Q8O33_07150 [Pseudomonadota bacterium]|nr:hypothetical protein [Pseudomonadota bacterium]